MEKRATSLVALALSFVLHAGCGTEAPPAPVSIAAAVNAEAARVEALQKSIDPAALPEVFRGSSEMTGTLVERVQSATSPTLRLYRLRDASTQIGALSFLAKNHTAITDLDKLRARWDAEGRSMSIESTRRGGTIVERALAQGARNRAMKLYKASLPYGKADAVNSGTYYLGEALAGMEYARFVESLPVAAAHDEPGPAPGAVEAAIAALEAELGSAFGRDRASRDAIYPSSLLKEARELEAQGLHDAAALSLMEARLAVSRATKKSADPAAPAPEIPASANGASLTSLFAGVARQRGPEFARIIVSDVLPFHAKLFEPVAVAARASAAVTVTLVRWPYT
jgi:hypothetical protein